MPDDVGADAATALVRARARRAVNGIIAVVAIVFIGASTLQIVEAVF